jgi:hypothetical protein
VRSSALVMLLCAYSFRRNVSHEEDGLNRGRTACVRGKCDTYMGCDKLSIVPPTCPRPALSPENSTESVSPVGDRLNVGLAAAQCIPKRWDSPLTLSKPQLLTYSLCSFRNFPPPRVARMLMQRGCPSGILGSREQKAWHTQRATHRGRARRRE